MRRYLILIAAIFMQMCLGATYSWAIFVQPLKEQTGLLQGTLQIPFSVFYFVFPFTLIFSNKMLLLFGPQKLSWFGGLLFGGGWVLAQFGSVHFLFVILGIGLLAGIGVGLVYLIPVTIGLMWFPERKGLVTGITVAGFGGGAALVSQIAGWGMQSFQASPYLMFGILGIAFFIIIGIGGIIMKKPPHLKQKRIAPLPTSEIVNNKIFWVLYLAMFTGLAAGLAVNANLKELKPSSGLESGIIAVALFAVANAAGRIVWGWLFDKVRSQTAIMINLFCQAIVLVFMSFILKFSYGLHIFALLTGFNYGGVLVLFASGIARIWGIERVHQVYGLLFSVHFLATLAPMSSGYAYDLIGGFQIPFLVIGTLLFLAVSYVYFNSARFSEELTLIN